LDHEIDDQEENNYSNEKLCRTYSILFLLKVKNLISSEYDMIMIKQLHLAQKNKGLKRTREKVSKTNAASEDPPRRQVSGLSTTHIQGA